MATTPSQANIVTHPHYAIRPKDYAGHIFHVTLSVHQPDPAGQILRLPAWIPGSYLVRDFARHIISIQARTAGKKVVLKKLDKDSWQAAPVSGALTIELDIYAWDLSVRAAHLDQSHAFFNGSSVFLRVIGQEHLPHIVDIQKPDAPHTQTWRVATSLPELQAKRYGFGSYIAENYDALIDHPVEIGDFQLASFTAHGTKHDLAITGITPNLDMARITTDLQKICEAQIALFEPKSKRAPMQRYVFLTMVVGDGYGGLEHRSSTALICNRNDLPVVHQAEMSEAYRGFLGLCSHEYFHTWNVKRIKPVAFADYDLQQENYTSLLWLFEGFTSYYDDLILVRTGLINEATYYKMLAKTVNAVMRGSGRKKQSVAESSFDAWTKYYRQDENSPNAIVSYYTKGSLVGLALDLSIRIETSGKKSLDDVMRALWKKFGRDFFTNYAMAQQQGLAEDEVEHIIHSVTGVDVKNFFARYVYGTADLPLAQLLTRFGITSEDQNKHDKPNLGIRVSQNGNDLKLANVYEGKPAHKAGLSAGDVLVAINGLRVTAADAADSLGQRLSRYRVGEKIRIHAFRRDELQEYEVKLTADDEVTLAFSIADKTGEHLKRPSSVKK